MKQAIISPRLLSGEVVVPPSKSYAHRALIAAALATEESVIRNLAMSEDILATISGLQALGATITLDGDTAHVTGITSAPKAATVDCRESGSTLRFLLPIAAALSVSATFTGTGRLPARPLTLYRDCFPAHGVAMEPASGMPLTLSGKLTSGTYSLAGNISSQFITGLLFALPLLEGDSEILLTSPLESKGYVDMTVEILGLAGIVVRAIPNGYAIRGGQRYRPFTYTVEGDYSQAAFFLVAGAIGDQPITCKGLNPDSVQGDKKILALLQRAGARLEQNESTATIFPVKLNSFIENCSDIPDLVPILAVLASYCEGVTQLTHIERLQIKESNRIQTTAELLIRFGVPCQYDADKLIITGTVQRQGCLIDSHNDHRIAMAAAIMATRADADVTIENADCVKKSYPNFFEDYHQLGGNVDVISME